MHKRVRRLALFGIFAFLVASAAVHFTFGSAIATYFPSWRYAPPPEQAISIISLSRDVREQPTPKPTPPPALPKIALRTAMHLAPLKYREMTGNASVALHSIRPPARRKSNIFLVGPRLPKPGTREAPAVSNAVVPTPSPGVVGARVDTGGNNDELNGATVWGDNNPVRVLHLAALALTTTPIKPVRIEVEVGPDGNVLDAHVLQSSGDPNLDAMALDAARKTVFAPATANGLPVHGSIILEYPPPTAST